MTDPKSEWKAGDRVRLKLCKMRHRYAWARVNWWLFWWLFADRCGGVPSWLDRITERAEDAWQTTIKTYE